MNTSTPPKGLALTLILLGSLVIIGACVAYFVTDAWAWRYVMAGAGAVQFTGWVLHGHRSRRLRGDAR